jgi:predicted nucleic acid-binding protein
VLTFDTGALIALERRNLRMCRVFATATADNAQITIPSAVVAEWWRGRSDLRESILASCVVEPLSERLSKVVGEALAAIKSSTVVDAIVMASAASRGDLVYTSDPDDLERLRRYFPAVRVLAV